MAKEEVLIGRCISPKHVEAYKTGIFKNLFKYITEDPELSLEMRLKNEAKVYYRKKLLLTTSFDSKETPHVQILDKNYYKGQAYPFKEKENLENLSNLCSFSNIKDYFKKAKRLAYFKSMGEEFSFQQNIAMGNHSFDNKYLVVDMEWEFKQAGSKNPIKITRPDLVIVEVEKNKEGYNDIYLAELKVGTGATGGKSGIIDHVNKTFEIIGRKDACASLIQDVTSIIANKTALGIISGNPEEFRFAEKPKMMLISAYRGEKEKQELEIEAQKAKKLAKEKGMEEPKCLLYNALITLTEYGEH